MKQDKITQQLRHQLAQVARQPRALVGVDGYVDRIQRVVQHTNAAGENTYYSSLATFGDRIVKAAGKSTQIEIVSHLIKAGGNAPILSEALAKLGTPNTCLGTFGLPDIHPVFKRMDAACDLVSVGDPGLTNAIEFDDGKLMLSEVATFDKIDWAYLSSQVGLSMLTELVKKSELLALVDWSNLPHATNIWAGFLNDILRPNPALRPKVFFDLCDPAKKTEEQIGAVLALISDYGDLTEVTLGLNANEATQLYHWTRRKQGLVEDHPSMIKQGAALFAYLGGGVDLIIHPIDACYLFTKTANYHRKGRVVAKPRVSTGGGDNFNAGYCFGMLQGYAPEVSMELAMATSGAYVQSGKSPRPEDVIGYLKSK